MSSLLTSIGAISAGLFVITLVIGAIVKLVMNLSGKSVITPNQSTRKLLFYECIVSLCSMLISFIGQMILIAWYELSSAPMMDKVFEFLIIASFITISIYIYLKVLKPKKVSNFYWKVTLMTITVLLPLYSLEQLIETLNF